MGSSDETRIAFFDVETTIPTQVGQGYSILEFGAILVCPRKLLELHSYSTLVRPSNLSLISSLSVRCNGITRDAVLTAPTFAEIADDVYDILHGRIWAGHNILSFDCPRIREAFTRIGRPAPEPSGTIDSLKLLTQKFGRRAGDMKMASLATYFGLGQQKHRSLDDVRMNLEVVKYCATVLFLESSLPDILTSNSWVSPNATKRSRCNGLSPSTLNVKNSTSNSSQRLRVEASSSSSSMNQEMEEKFPLLAVNNEEPADTTPSMIANPIPFDMSPFTDEMNAELKRLEADDLDSPCQLPPMEVLQHPTSEVSRTPVVVLAPEEISIPLLVATLVPYYRGTQRITLLHNGASFQLYSCRLRVRFGVKNFGDGGRPRFSFIVDATPTICQILDACDDIAQKLSSDSGSSSEWKPVVTRKCGFINSPTLRMHIHTINVDGLQYQTQIYKKQTSGGMEKFTDSQCNVEELEALIKTGTLVDVYFSLESYDIHQNAGIRAVLKKLYVCS
ncbi:hypothetical protein SAY86_006815 [Trapa natans]|uniref:Exonuclease domain-containing protein n=1 Tax=Trapa natans TaxID=22666 RepID=A0AAN7LEY6_TRANT|nr:hypothetical protein SAY86_006815 [Trapa natans]